MSDTASEKEVEFSVDDMRAAYEHRALWLYLLSDSPENDGEHGPLHQAIRKCGYIHAATKFSPFESIEAFHSAFTAEPVTSVFDVETTRLDDTTMEVEFHYCPLVESWKKAGATDAEIKALCDIAMDGDRGIAEKLGLKFELPKTIAAGDDVCCVRMSRE